MNKNLPVIKKEKIFTKIKKWFKELFGISETYEESAQVTENQRNNKMEETKRNSFIEEIKVESKDTILALQRKIEEKEIEISDLTDKQLDEITELYKKQIEERKNKLKYYREKLRRG